MKKQLLRIITKCGAFIAGVMFAAFADLTCNMILDYETEGILFPVVFMILFMGIVYILNNVHDQDNFRNIRKRWCANTLFLTLIMLVIELLARSLNSSGISEQQSVLYEFFYAFAVVVAVHLYERNYYRFFPKDERMQVLANKNVRNHNRVIVLVTDVKKNKGLYECEGRLIGNLRSLEKMYMYRTEKPLTAVQCVKVLSTEGNTDGCKKVAFTCKSKTKIEKFAVLSTVRDIHRMSPESDVENSWFTGLYGSYSEFYRETPYMIGLTDALFKAQLLVPVKCPTMEKGMITQMLPPNTPISIPSVSRPDKEEEKILPVFTDWDKLMKWKGFTDCDDSSVIVADYQKLRELHDGNFDGIVVNPFNIPSFFIGEDLLALMKDLESDRK